MEECVVSIIIPVYNVEKYLRESLDSICNQSYQNIEIIIVNDGSTDSSYEICKEYEKKYYKIKLINQSNQGLSGARNVGLMNATGKYIYFFDSDDVLAQSAIEEMTCFMEHNNLDIVMIEADCFGDLPVNLNVNQYRHTELSGYKVFLIEDFIKTIKYINSPVWLFMYRKNLIEDNKLIFYPNILHEDELYTTIVISRVKKIGFINKPFFKRRYRKNSIMTSSSNFELHKAGYQKVVEELCKYVEYNEINVDVLKLFNKKITQCLLGMHTLGEASMKEMLEVSKNYHLKPYRIVKAFFLYKLKILLKKLN